MSDKPDQTNLNGHNLLDWATQCDCRNWKGGECGFECDWMLGGGWRVGCQTVSLPQGCCGYTCCLPSPGRMRVQCKVVWAFEKHLVNPPFQLYLPLPIDGPMSWPPSLSLTFQCSSVAACLSHCLTAVSKKVVGLSPFLCALCIFSPVVFPALSGLPSQSRDTTMRLTGSSNCPELWARMAPRDSAINWRLVQGVTPPSPWGTWERLIPMTLSAGERLIKNEWVVLRHRSEFGI